LALAEIIKLRTVWISELMTVLFASSFLRPLPRVVIGLKASEGNCSMAYCSFYVEYIKLLLLQNRKNKYAV